jgi:hypothetical protein
MKHQFPINHQSYATLRVVGIRIWYLAIAWPFPIPLRLDEINVRWLVDCHQIEAKTSVIKDFNIYIVTLNPIKENVKQKHVVERERECQSERESE